MTMSTIAAALAVHRVVSDLNANLATIERMAHEAADAGAELVVFSETALTGFIANGDPAHDLPLGQPIPAPATERLAAVARKRRLWLALGMYERVAEGEQAHLYDVAVLLGPDGAIHLKYRRITPQWHRRNADPAIYRQGSEIPTATTPLGTCAFLLCGDLFCDPLVDRLRELRPNCLLFCC
ncbi:MAG: carbon-nitrogen hydrolase family protein [Chloroflexi bacterium]|nr:carbon-nitrogen hydrolase family protein [Chloroflexota bacterium]